MTGLAQARFEQPASESEVLRDIGRIAWSAPRIEHGLEEIASAVFRLPGMHVLELHVETMPVFTKAAYGACRTSGSAVEAVQANGLTWGTLRIYFDPALAQVETPLRFTRFVAQQIALLLDRLSLLREIEMQHRRLAHLKRRLETRKAVHRAAGVLAQARDIPDADALRIIIQEARRSRRTLLHLAQALILGFEAPGFHKPVLRRLGPAQYTAPYDRQGSAAHA
ncbi:MAG: ANTAR domain-containing protein [Acidobacteriaceae bacterium]|nr:ANTAR domain-containing protein [Acidobacteriaceae bacterium]